MFARFIFKTEFNDYLFGYLIAIVCLLIGAIFEQGLAFGIIFLAFNLVLSWCLIFYTLMSEQTGSSSANFKAAGKNETPGTALLSWTTGLVILSFAMTAVIFISFPRFGLGFMLSSETWPMEPAKRAFGHAGAGGSMGIADPEAGIGFGYAMNQMRSEAGDEYRYVNLLKAVYASL